MRRERKKRGGKNNKGTKEDKKRGKNILGFIFICPHKFCRKQKPRRMYTRNIFVSV